MMGYRPPQYRRGLKHIFLMCFSFILGYRPPQYRRGLKLNPKLKIPNNVDIDHPNIEGD